MNHFRDVNDFFKGSHLTINARTEDEVEPEIIMNKINKVSVKVNVKDRIDISENVGPVGTNYKRIQPQREINVGDREKFWQKTQEDEKKRLVDEKKRLSESREKLERERQEREIKEAKQREEAIREREKQVNKIREAQRNSENAIQNNGETNKQVNDVDEDERRRRSESLRKERAEEAKSVISHGSIRSARAIFEQNTSAGQMSSIKGAINDHHKVKEPIRIKERVPQTVTTKVIETVKHKEEEINVREQNTDFDHNKHEVFQERNQTQQEQKPQIISEPTIERQKETIQEIKQQPQAHQFQSQQHAQQQFQPEPVQEIKQYQPEPQVKQIKFETQSEPESEPEPVPEPVPEPEPEPETEQNAFEVKYTRNLLQETYMEPEPLEDIAEEEQNWDGN